MPRNPAAKKHQHNNRHENGLVGPGKRVSKQKSNGHLNGAAKGPVPSESVSQSSSAESSVTGSVHEQTTTAYPDSNPDPPKASISKPAESEAGEIKDKEVPKESNGSAMLQQKRGDASTAQAKSIQDFSAFQIASTILKSRPACDTISLLIVLLALPTMILTIVQAFFASLTLLPGGSSSSAFLSLVDIFHGSAGAPSITTRAIVDIICFGLWLCLWPWAQNFTLDLAQIQIAMVLGNGSSGRNGRVNTFCLTGVLLLHLVRSKGVRRFLFANFVPTELISQLGLSEYLRYLPSDADFGQSPRAPSQIRSLFAIHIISQAVLAVIRRRLKSANSQGPTKAKRVDMEASVGAFSDFSTMDGTSSTAISSSVDYQPPPTPGLKEGKEKNTSAKKRRKQANHVRSKQPFWAALASTKVHVIREVEHNKALPTVANNQGTPFEPAHRDLVWVTNVDPSSISFETSYAGSTEEGPDAGSSSETKPFYVRINGAKWHSVTLEALENASQTESSSAQWSGTISGLAPNCTYTCTFIRADGDEEYASVMVRTPMLLDKDVSGAMVPLPVRQSTRPSSPTTTLKNSIATAEANLNESRNRLNKARRQHRTTLAKVEREVDSYNTRLRTAGDDNKQKQKLLQAERSIEQTRTATQKLDADLEGLVTTPEDDIEDHSASQSAFETQSRVLAEAKESLASASSAADTDLQCAKTELTTVVTRKERLTGRNAKLTEQHDRITQANAQGLNERERKAAESNAKDTDQQRREVDLLHHIQNLEGEVNSQKMRLDANRRQLRQFEEEDARQILISSSGPLTPEGELPGTRQTPQHARPYAFGSFQAFPNSPVIPEVQGSPFLAYAKTLPSTDQRRPRSNTNQSAGGISNLSAEFEDADPIPPMPSTTEYEVMERKGSGSSRGHTGSPAAGIIGSALRSPQRGSYSPGHVPGSTTW
ncbi:hypothetical protein EDD37DRAFT_622302 [Exophiala viscosa]|uniref:uncharacterized protein n=1 Tax=Exophiala viscosa TaxID=2486360 RepID=UPI002199149A|nr:hypothetical protein EDD37DRAFT_622302 [Exophiala viscosa]